MEGNAARLSELKKSLDNLSGEVKSTFADMQKQIEEKGEANPETKAKLEELTGGYSQVTEDLKALSDRMEEVELKIGRASAQGATDAAEGKTLGQLFVEHEKTKVAHKGGATSTRKVKMPIGLVRGHQQKAFPDPVSGDSGGGGGALVDEFRWDTVIQQPLRPRRLVDQIQAVMVSSNAVEYPEESVTHQLSTELTTTTAAVDTSLEVERTAGMFPGQVLYLDGGNVEVTVDTVTDATNVALTGQVGAIVNSGTEVYSDEFVFTPEAQLKPMARLEYDLVTTSIKTLATMMPFSKQMLEDFPGLQSLIDSRLREFLELNKERQILYGADTSSELAGILTNADILTYSWSSGTVGDTKLDAIRRAATLASLSHLPPDTTVIHPSDLEDIELAKGEDGHYLFFQSQVSTGIQRIWRMEVIESPVIDQGTALVGSFRLGAIIWDRMQAEMAISDQNRDWFEKNILGIRVEERMALQVVRPKAFVQVTFDNEPGS